MITNIGFTPLSWFLWIGAIFVGIVIYVTISLLILWLATNVPFVRHILKHIIDRANYDR